MKRIVVGLILLFLLFSGCTANTSTGESNTSNNKSNAELKSVEPICGNGIQESGETSANCCLDVECGEFFSCKELEQGDKKINTCVKAKLEETKDYKNLLDYYTAESAEYDKESDLIDYDYILTKIDQMDRAVKGLEGMFDVSLEKTFVQYRYDRREWNVKRDTAVQKLAEETDEDKQIEIYEQIISLDKQELERLKSFSEEEIDEITSIFDYDILERQSTLQSMITEEETYLETWKQGYQITLEIIDYSPTCYSYSNECYLDYVKLSIKNNGNLALQNPTFDFYIIKDDQVISREIDQYTYYFKEIPKGYDGVYKEESVGLSDNDKLQPGSYTLKVDLKSGITPKIISTISKNITIR